MSFAPAGTATPPTSVSRVATRRQAITEVSKRRVSSMAPGDQRWIGAQLLPDPGGRGGEELPQGVAQQVRRGFKPREAQREEDAGELSIVQGFGISGPLPEELAGQIILGLVLAQLDEPLAVVPEGGHIGHRPQLILR
jgi:hypothetical protein